MKQILLFAAFFLLAGVSVNAQKEAKSCDKPCTPSEKAACTHGEKASSADASTDVSKAMMAANKDESIEAKTCEKSGTVSFYKKDVCEKSGKVSYTEVEYSETNETFAVKASNDETPVADAPKAKKAECSPKEKASCSSKASSKKDACCSSKASKASATSSKKPACCSSKAGKKSCSSKS